MLKFEHPDGRIVYIRADAITAIGVPLNVAHINIHVGSETYSVRGTAEEAVDRITARMVDPLFMRGF